MFFCPNCKFQLDLNKRYHAILVAAIISKVVIMVPYELK